MKLISTLAATFLVVLSFCLPSSYAQSGRWPLKIKLDLSSGFGDFRDGRFHTGIDIRTGGTTGKLLYSPVDGYVYRLKMSYTGSGKALYIMGDDGFMYIFYHLMSFNDEIDKAVKNYQVADQRYYIDKYLPKDSLRVAQDQFLGFTGQTGTGAPHLHFEVRTTDNRPINPLANGYTLPDKTRPTISQIGFELVDDHSLFRNGARVQYIPVKASSPGQYEVEGMPYFTSPFGIMIDGYDMTRPDGMKQNIYDLQVELDGRSIYRSTYDSLDFDTERSVLLEYDVARAADDDKRTRRLYLRKGDAYAGSHQSGDGIIGEKGLTVGPHKLLVTATDNFGNASHVAMNFVWGPDEPLPFDSVQVVSDTVHEYYFTKTDDFDKLKTDSIVILGQQGENWTRVDRATVTELDNRKLRVTLVGLIRRSQILAVALHSAFGAELLEPPFNGILDRAGKRVNMQTEIYNGGLIVSINTDARAASKLNLLFYYKGKLLGTEKPRQFFSVSDYYVYVPPCPQYARVDQIGVRWSDNPEIRVTVGMDLNLAVAGYEKESAIPIDSMMTIRLGSDCLFEPQWVRLEHTQVVMKNRLNMNSELYTIYPEAFATSADFQLNCRMVREGTMNEHSGLAWLDEKENRWVWLDDSQVDGEEVSATSMGGGKFAVIYDLEPPEISRMNLVAGNSVETPYPLIEFTVVDSLSGIADDRAFDIRIDKKWLIPEYDPETGICKAQPVEPLEPGDHYLAVQVHDRAGQMAEQYLIFNVADMSGR